MLGRPGPDRAAGAPRQTASLPRRRTPITGRGPDDRAAAAAASPTTSSASPNTDPVGVVARQRSAVKLVEQPGEQRPHALRAPGEPAQPATHRLGGRPNSPRSGGDPDRPPSPAARHRSPGPHPPGAQASRPATTRACPGTASRRATRTARPDRVLVSHAPRPGIAPGPQLAGHSGQRSPPPPDPVDLDRVRTYHRHGCLQAPSNGPPFRSRIRGGPLRFHNVVTLSSRTKKGNPRAALHNIVSVNDANQAPRRQPRRRSTPGPSGSPNTATAPTRCRRSCLFPPGEFLDRRPRAGRAG